MASKAKDSADARALNLLERVLTIRPDAGLDEVRRMAPAFGGLTDAELSDRIGRMRQRIAAKASQQRKRLRQKKGG
ncbi:MAG: hypothetical protein WD270_02410 [Acetobacterales bacterium]